MSEYTAPMPMPSPAPPVSRVPEWFRAYLIAQRRMLKTQLAEIEKLLTGIATGSER